MAWRNSSANGTDQHPIDGQHLPQSNSTKRVSAIHDASAVDQQQHWDQVQDSSPTSVSHSAAAVAVRSSSIDAPPYELSLENNQVHPNAGWTGAGLREASGFDYDFFQLYEPLLDLDEQILESQAGSRVNTFPIREVDDQHHYSGANGSQQSDSHLLSPLPSNNPSPEGLDLQPVQASLPRLDTTNIRVDTSLSPSSATFLQLRSPSKTVMGSATPTQASPSGLSATGERANLIESHITDKWPSLDAKNRIGHEQRAINQAGLGVVLPDHQASFQGREDASGDAVSLKVNTLRTGVAPDARHLLNQDSVPSINDEANRRETETKNTGIADWLQRAEATAVPETDSNAYHNPNVLPTGPGPSHLHDNDDRMADHGLDSGEYDDESGEEDDDDDDRTERFPNLESTSKDEDLRFEQSLPSKGESISSEHPVSSSDAMALFEKMSKEIEAVSRTATMATTIRSLRRRSETDLSSYAASSTETERFGKGIALSKASLSLFERLRPGRSSSHVRKHREDASDEEVTTTITQNRKESQTSLSTGLKRFGSRSKRPQPVQEQQAGPLSPGGGNATSLSPSVAFNSLVESFRRARSKSDAGRVQGLTERWAASGGPPISLLKAENELLSPLQAPIPSSPISAPSRQQDLEDDESELKISPVDQPSRLALKGPITPTYEGFKAHVLQSGLKLEPYLVDRIAKEQLQRFDRLLNTARSHLAAAQKGKCSSGDRCRINGTGPQYLQPKTNIRTSEPPTFYHIPHNGTEHNQSPTESSPVITANFPAGIPLPPVERLPAEFECPLCFHVKKFLKPSDWTKHVHEDLQPFTCSFPECPEPKSFKRKADWVRHENELHRQLEKWECDFRDCTHVCSRRDNFVQHLVREHRQPEPRVRNARATRGRSAHSEENSVITAHVDRCRQDTSKTPEDEPCRFCGDELSTWKKLTVHLAGHMQDISLPVLGLVKEASLVEDNLDWTAQGDVAATYAVASHNSLSTATQDLAYQVATPFPDASGVPTWHNEPVSFPSQTGAYPQTHEGGDEITPRFSLRAPTDVWPQHSPQNGAFPNHATQVLDTTVHNDPLSPFSNNSYQDHDAYQTDEYNAPAFNGTLFGQHAANPLGHATIDSQFGTVGHMGSQYSAIYVPTTSMAPLQQGQLHIQPVHSMVRSGYVSAPVSPLEQYSQHASPQALGMVSPHSHSQRHSPSFSHHHSPYNMHQFGPQPMRQSHSTESFQRLYHLHPGPDELVFDNTFTQSAAYGTQQHVRTSSNPQQPPYNH